MAARKNAAADGLLDAPVWKDWLFWVWILALATGIGVAYTAAVDVDVYGQETVDATRFVIVASVASVVQTWLFLWGAGTLRKERRAKRQVISAAASWQHDPTGRHELRWWDGAGWTSRVSSRGLTGSDPYP